MSESEEKKIFQKNLYNFVSASEKSQKEIANAIGVSPQTFNTWIQGIAIPRMGKIQLLADYFNISKSDLIEEHSEPLPAPPSSFLSADEEALLADFRNLNKQGKEKAAEYISDLAGNEKYIKDIPADMIKMA